MFVWLLLAVCAVFLAFLVGLSLGAGLIIRRIRAYRAKFDPEIANQYDRITLVVLGDLLSHLGQ